MAHAHNDHVHAHAHARLLAAHLADRGYGVVDGFLEAGAARLVEGSARELYARGGFAAGAVGGGATGEEHAYASTIVRGDTIRHLGSSAAHEAGLGAVIDAADALISNLRQLLPSMRRCDEVRRPASFFLRRVLQ